VDFQTLTVAEKWKNPTSSDQIWAEFLFIRTQPVGQDSTGWFETGKKVTSRLNLQKNAYQYENVEF